MGVLEPHVRRDGRGGEDAVARGREVIGRLLFAWAALLPTAAFAFELDGLSVDLPEGYAAEAAPGRAGTTTIGILPPAGGPAPTGTFGDYACTLVFKGHPPDSPLRSKSQTWLNGAAMEQDAIANMVGRTLRDGVPLIEGNTLVGGVVWLELVGIPKREAQTRVAYWTAETPAGATTLSCAVSAGEFDSAFPALRAIRDGTAPPR